MAPPVLFAVRGGVGFARLNRPEALNALTVSAVRSLARMLSAWEQDPAVRAVVLEGAGEQAFCAGGDVRSLYEAGLRGDFASAERFFREEYRLDLLVARYPKPVAAVLGGVVMGGGVGLTIHCPYRIVTEHTRWAMPETGIGFFPDVGSSYFLPRLPGRLGLYLALTGARLGPAELVGSGLATHYVPAERLPRWRSSLEPECFDASLAAVSEAPPDELRRSLSAELEECFSAPSLSAVLAFLGRSRRPAVQSILRELREKSPTSLRVTFRQLTGRAVGRLEDAFRLEYRLSRRFLRGHDFYEGVRSVLVEKDRRPAWRPARLEEVSEEQVEAHFEPLEDGSPDLRLSNRRRTTHDAIKASALPADPMRVQPSVSRRRAK
ncbi:MAG: enoyl-CoA hydratase/isomerase family protein [Deltaproteobacteria bacterium]|nr:enoyl-CoA hydratase/isomerase family protein [Deltaproteobacteria bacterium]